MLLQTHVQAEVKQLEINHPIYLLAEAKLSSPLVVEYMPFGYIIECYYDEYKKQ